MKSAGTAGVRTGLVAAVLLGSMVLGLLGPAGPAAADVVQTTKNGGTDFGRDFWNNQRFNNDNFYYFYVDAPYAITRFSVAVNFFIDNDNDIRDIDAVISHPDGANYQFMRSVNWWETSPWGSGSGNKAVSATDITAFNDKLGTGWWRMEIRDRARWGGNWDGQVNSFTLSIYYAEPKITATGPAAGNLSGTQTVTATIVGAGIQRVTFSVDGQFVGDMTYNAGTGNYEFALDTTLWNDGPHTLTVRAEDWQGRVDTRTRSVTFDNYAPAIQFLSPASGTYPVAPTLVRLAGEAKESAMTVTMNLTAPGGANTSYNLSRSGNYYDYTLDPAQFADGTYALNAEARDSAGNRRTAGPVTVYIDNSAPVLALNSPRNGEFVSGSVAADLAGTSDLFPDAVEWRVDSGAWNPAPGKWNTTFIWDTAAQTDGDHTLTVRARDMAGRTTSASVTVSVANSDPVLQAATPSEGQFIEGTAVFRALARSGVGIASVTLTLDTSSSSLGPVVLSDSASSGFYEASIDTRLLRDGNATLVYRASDPSGRAVATTGLTVNIDNTPPDLALLSPREGDRLAGGVNITASASDAFPVDLFYSIDETGWAALPKSGAVWSSGAVPDGPHTISVRAVDAAGHESLESVSVTVDNGLPAVQVLYPAAGIFTEGTITVKLAVSDDVRVAGAKVVIDGAERSTAFNAISGAYETAVDTRVLSDGPHTLYGKVSDSTGHTVSSTDIVFNVDNTPPVLRLVAPKNGEWLTPLMGDVKVEVNTSDAFEVTVTYSIDSAGSWPVSRPLSPASLTEGRHTLEVRAVDRAGHSTTVTAGFGIHLKAPVLTVFSPAADTHIARSLFLKAGLKSGQPAVSFTRSIDGGAAVEVFPDASGGFYEERIALPAGAPADGTHTITLLVVDAGGLSTNTTIPFFLDNSPPVVAMTTSKTVQGTAILRFNISKEDTGVGSLTLSIDGKRKGALTARSDGNYQFGWNTVTKDNGQHTVRVTATDTLGNTKEYSFTVTVANPDYGWVPGALILVLIIGGFAFMWLRLRQPPEPQMAGEAPPQEMPSLAPPSAPAAEPPQAPPAQPPMPVEPAPAPAAPQPAPQAGEHPHHAHHHHAAPAPPPAPAQPPQQAITPPPQKDALDDLIQDLK